MFFISALLHLFPSFISFLPSSLSFFHLFPSFISFLPSSLSFFHLLSSFISFLPSSLLSPSSPSFLLLSPFFLHPFSLLHPPLSSHQEASHTLPCNLEKANEDTKAVAMELLEQLRGLLQKLPYENFITLARLLFHLNRSVCSINLLACN